MLDHSAAMLAFIKLAGVSQSKQQLAQRDKFLLLAAATAVESGFDQVAERCRQLVLDHNPAHLIHRFESVPFAISHPEYQSFQRQLKRFCSYEKAEHHLTQLKIAPGLPGKEGNLSVGDYALLLLGHASDSGPK
ncbi:MAG: hypothetical protein HZA46_13730 [Planctomycetales bacterium]|nr:hypothetical protein [Planctomycetales bacterium]